LKNVSPGLLLWNYNDIHGNEANWLGGCLQIPFDGLVTVFLKGKSQDEVCLQYGASLDMVKFHTNKSRAKQKVHFIKNKGR